MPIEGSWRTSNGFAVITLTRLPGGVLQGNVLAQGTTVPLSGWASEDEDRPAASFSFLAMPGETVAYSVALSEDETTLNAQVSKSNGVDVVAYAEVLTRDDPPGAAAGASAQAAGAGSR